MPAVVRPGLSEGLGLDYGFFDVNSRRPGPPLIDDLATLKVRHSATRKRDGMSLSSGHYLTGGQLGCSP